MFHYVWPMVLIVISNTLYQICAKSVPDKMNPFASLTLTYAIATALRQTITMECCPYRSAFHKYKYQTLYWIDCCITVISSRSLLNLIVQKILPKNSKIRLMMVCRHWLNW